MKLGIIGGSGIYDIEEMQDVESKDIDTPFGKPSDAYVQGVLNGREVVFLPRHGKGHRILPSEINSRANICGMKMLGVDCVVSVSAVGSLREELRPGDILLPDQFYDRTKSWERHTFFGNGVVAHVSFGDPTCEELRKSIADVSRNVIEEECEDKDIRICDSGTYVNMEGPAFSTRAESQVHRQLGFDVVGMTNLPEARLCREAELCYQSIAMVTDFDCWRESEESVNIEMLIATLTANASLAKLIVKRLIKDLPETRSCGCGNALDHAIITDMSLIPEEVKEKLKPIAGKYLM